MCPLTLTGLAKFYDLIQDSDYAKDTQVLMVSVDPERDSAEKLKDYMAFFNKDFVGVTGEFLEIFNLAKQLNIAFSYEPGESADNYLVSHTGSIVIINPNGHYHGFLKVPHDPNKINDNYRSIRNIY